MILRRISGYPVRRRLFIDRVWQLQVGYPWASQIANIGLSPVKHGLRLRWQLLFWR